MKCVFFWEIFTLQLESSAFQMIYGWTASAVGRNVFLTISIPKGYVEHWIHSLSTYFWNKTNILEDICCGKTTKSRLSEATHVRFARAEPPSLMSSHAAMLQFPVAGRRRFNALRKMGGYLWFVEMVDFYFSVG